ncbi:MAG TPA: hypothetical protein VGM13_10645 [Thermoanaerobaculia bacterium]|jgi:hypothetical protein
MPSRAELFKEIDSYRDTVYFLTALIHELSWDETQKKKTSGLSNEHGAEQIYGGGSVTPDLALLKCPEWGVLGEAKTSFSKSNAGRDKIRDQLLKYDAVATRWLGDDKRPARVKEAACVLLTHMSRKVEAADYLDAERTAGRFQPVRPFAIVAAARIPQVDVFIHLEKSYGSLVPRIKDEKLRKTVQVKLEQLRVSHDPVHFYDSSPPMPWLLTVLWDELLPSLIPENEFGERKRELAVQKQAGYLGIELSVDDAAAKLRDRFSMRLLNPNLPESPRLKEVEAAFQLLVTWGLAKKLEGREFGIGYKKLRNGSLDYFLKKLSSDKEEPRLKTKDKKQIPLFPEPDSSIDIDPKESAKPAKALKPRSKN